MKEKALSLLLCFVYLVGSYLYADAGAILFVAAGLIVPLALIWFGEELASFFVAARKSAKTGNRITLTFKVVGWVCLVTLPWLAFTL